MFINFSDIPGHHNLFLDYLYEFDNVKEFYKYNFRNKEDFNKIFKGISDSQREFRDELSNIIKEDYSHLNPSEKTLDNLESLKSKETLAVVTGQQLGIVGGPLYTFYKIITAIKLSQYLAERFENFKFVPVFWLEGDDHDFNEIRSINIIDDNNDLKKISYGNEIAEDDNKQSTGFLEIDDTINNFFEELNNNLRDTDFKNDLFEKLKSFYSPGKKLKQGFKELLFWLFDEYGLVIFDPQNTKVKNLLKPIFKKEINNFREHTEKIVKVSGTLEETYHAQVKVNPVNLFYSTEDGRFLIEPVENEFRLKRKRKKFSQEELLDLIENEPQNFSPNVLLRPICQDYLLPTAFYIAGPSEISYFAQVTPLYDFFDVSTPVIYPRSSVTVLEKNINSVIVKYDLDLQSFFIDVEKLKKKVLESISKITLDEMFGETESQLEIAMDKLKERLFEFDKTISNSSGKYKEKIMHYLNELKGKAFDAQKKQHEITLRQIDKALMNLYPNSNLQEREINFVLYFNKYGKEFLNKIIEEIEINKYEHQVIKF